jgi:transcriptional regulator with XRE-family HTH domain
MKDLADRLRQVRRSSGLSIAAVAEAIGSASSYLSLVETGKRKPSLELIETLAAFFGVRRDWLETGGGEQFADVSDSRDESRLFRLLEEANSPETEGETRKTQLLAEISVRLSQLKLIDEKRWLILRGQIVDAIDGYAQFCFEHHGKLKVAARKSARSRRG